MTKKGDELEIERFRQGFVQTVYHEPIGSRSSRRLPEPILIIGKTSDIERGAGDGDVRAVGGDEE